MNEKIKELAEEVGLKDIGGLYGGEFIGAIKPEYLEKFAELIIKECVNVGYKTWLKDNSTVPTFPSRQIKQHFGIEE